MESKIIALLKENGLENYLSIFEQNKLDTPDILSEITEDDLEKMGITIMGDRKRLIKLFSKNVMQSPQINTSPVQQPAAIVINDDKEASYASYRNRSEDSRGYSHGSAYYADSYVANNMLLKNEKIISSTRIHWGIYIPFFFNLFITFIILMVHIASLEDYYYDGWWLYFFWIFLVFDFFIWLIAFLRRKNTEFVLTDRRVILKTGIFSIKTDAINLEKIESVGIGHPFIGRMFNYGKVIIKGTGSSTIIYDFIENPNEYKRAIENMIEARLEGASR